MPEANTTAMAPASSAKTVLITGSTRGIGLAFVDLYIKNGWKVIGAARNLDAADQLKQLKPYKIVQLDTSDEQSILRAAQELQGESIDLLINNAGIACVETVESTTKTSLMHHFEVNAVGPFLVTRAFLPQLRAAVSQRGSAVVGQITSTMGSISMNDGGGFYSYRSSKTALNMINKSLAQDLKKDQIFAVTLQPGYVATDMTAPEADLLTSLFGQPIQPQESAMRLSEVLAKVTEAETGKFFDFEGQNPPW